MPWCPVCKNEYREGIKFCAECQVELVERLEEESGREDEAEREAEARLRAMLAAGAEEDGKGKGNAEKARKEQVAGLGKELTHGEIEQI